MKHGKTQSLIAMMAESPYIDSKMAGAISAHEDSFLHRVKKNGFIEPFRGVSKALELRTAYRLTDKGRDMAEVCSILNREAGRLPPKESMKDGVLYSSGLKMANIQSAPEGTHFRDPMLCYLWLQIRWHKKVGYHILWDMVKRNDLYPLEGKPDIVCYDKMDTSTGEISNLVLWELELTQKHAGAVYNRIEELTKNQDPKFIFVISPDSVTLKNFAIQVRKGIPSSGYFDPKLEFNARFLAGKKHLRCLWFVQWNSLVQPIRDNDLMSVVAKRADHPDFDYVQSWETDGTGKKIVRSPYQRWEGRTEIPVGTLLDSIGGAR